MISPAQQLIKLRNAHHLKVEAMKPWCEGLFKVRFYAGSSSWELYIEDEYQDFNVNHQFVCTYLVLRALEDYKIEEDFLKWAEYYALDASDPKWLDYYRSLSRMLQEIEAIIGTIDSFIPTMDYDLRSGAFAELLIADHI